LVLELGRTLALGLRIDEDFWVFERLFEVFFKFELLSFDRILLLLNKS
jgi:hypothetical protein